MAWRSLHLFRDLYRSRDAFPKPFLQSPIATLLHPALSSALLQRRSHADAAPPPSAVQNPKASNASGDENKSPPFRSSLNEAEVAKFAAIAETWWDFEGPFKPLHLMNPTRVSFIRSTLCRHFKKDPYCARPFQGLQIIDVGCGGGILSEPLARMGATVTGIDAVEKNIKIARIHAASDPVTSSIEYCCTTAACTRNYGYTCTCESITLRKKHDQGYETRIWKPQNDVLGCSRCIYAYILIPLSTQLLICHVLCPQSL